MPTRPVKVYELYIVLKIFGLFRDEALISMMSIGYLFPKESSAARFSDFPARHRHSIQSGPNLGLQIRLRSIMIMNIQRKPLLSFDQSDMISSIQMQKVVQCWTISRPPKSDKNTTKYFMPMDLTNDMHVFQISHGLLARLVDI